MEHRAILNASRRLSGSTPEAGSIHRSLTREMMLERQREGIAKAKREGKYKGRKPTARAKSEEVLRLLAEGVGPAQIAKRLGIGRKGAAYRSAGIGCSRDAAAIGSDPRLVPQGVWQGFQKRFRLCGEAILVTYPGGPPPQPES